MTYHTTVADILALNPAIHGDVLQIGMKLTLPAGTNTLPSAGQGTGMAARPGPGLAKTKIIVRAGDSLWSLALRYHTTVNRLQALNPALRDGITIKLGQPLWVLGEAARTSASTSHAAAVAAPGAHLSARHDGFGPTGASLDAQNLYWMAHVIHAEAGYESLRTQIAVGDVVWHRMLVQPGSTVKDIVFQQSNGRYQFSTVPQGYIYQQPDSQSQMAALDVLEKHQDLVPGAYVFYGANQTNDGWVLAQPVITRIGNMVFAK